MKIFDDITRLRSPESENHIFSVWSVCKCVCMSVCLCVFLCVCVCVSVISITQKQITVETPNLGVSDIYLLIYLCIYLFIFTCRPIVKNIIFGFRGPQNVKIHQNLCFNSLAPKQYFLYHTWVQESEN